MDQHYICKGDCGGVSDDSSAVCNAPDCSEKDQKMSACGCDDGEHKEAKGDEMTEDEQMDS